MGRNKDLQLFLEKQIEKENRSFGKCPCECRAPPSQSLQASMLFDIKKKKKSTVRHIFILNQSTRALFLFLYMQVYMQALQRLLNFQSNILVIIISSKLCNSSFHLKHAVYEQVRICPQLVWPLRMRENQVQAK